MSMEQVVVSAGDPVAYEVIEQSPRDGSIVGGGLTKDPAVVEDFRAREHGSVTPLFAAPVVLPEEPPADLIEQMARAAWESGVPNGFAWRDCDVDERDMYLMEARANFDALRAWVAAGGETR